jgi:hypothetical protein
LILTAASIIFTLLEMVKMQTIIKRAIQPEDKENQTE